MKSNGQPTISGTAISSDSGYSGRSQGKSWTETPRIPRRFPGPRFNRRFSAAPLDSRKSKRNVIPWSNRSSAPPDGQERPLVHSAYRSRRCIHVRRRDSAKVSRIISKNIMIDVFKREATSRRGSIWIVDSGAGEPARNRFSRGNLYTECVWRLASPRHHRREEDSTNGESVETSASRFSRGQYAFVEGGEQAPVMGIRLRSTVAALWPLLFTFRAQRLFSSPRGYLFIAAGGKGSTD